ncbi:YDG domain-containing protein, partial [Rubrivivax gelatinosus]
MLSTLLMVPTCVWALDASQLPTGGQVAAGQISIVQSGSTMTVRQATERGIVNWGSFDVGSQATVRFEQPTSSSVTLNRVVSGVGSVIEGRITSNGQVFLVNTSGLLFGKGAQVNVGGLVASTRDISDAAFLAGKQQFEGNSTGEVVNQGELVAAPGGFVSLLGARVANDGSIVSPGGDVLMAAGDKVSISVGTSGRLHLSLDSAAVGAIVRNGGVISAEAGQVILSTLARGGVVANSGLVEAHSLAHREGRILLLANMDDGTVGAAGRLDASAPVSGNGGFVETSAAVVQIDRGLRVNTKAARGETGHWLIDPTDFTVSAGSAAQTTSGIGADTLVANLENTSVTLQTQAVGSQAGNISVNADLAWSAKTQLALDAHKDIYLNGEIHATQGGLKLTAAGSIVAPAAVDVGQFILAKGTWRQIGSSLPQFKARDFRISPVSAGVATFIRALGGTGTSADPYRVSDAYGLQGIGSNPTNTLPKSWLLANDIDLTGSGIWNDGMGWSPIGSGASFSGSFDGGGHLVSGLQILRPSQSSVGLFGDVNGGTIADLRLKATTISGQARVGILAGQVTNSTILDVDVTGAASGSGRFTGLIAGLSNQSTFGDTHAKGNAQGASEVGGLVGGGTGTIEGSSADVDVLGEAGGDSIGGLVGYFGTIRNSQASGRVEGYGQKVGGLAGSATTIDGSSASGDVFGHDVRVGGLAGMATTVANSKATGSVESSAASAGGLIGYLGGSATGSAAFGDVTVAADKVATGVGVGGLVGTLDGTISASFAHGDVRVASGSSSAIDGVGGLVGNAKGTVTASGASGSVSHLGRVDGVAGGLVGVARYDNTALVLSIGKSWYTGSVESVSNAGGLVGDGDGRVSISDSWVTGSVTGGGSVGGIIGVSYNGGYSFSEILRSYSGAKVNGKIAGGVAGSWVGNIANVYSTGDVSGGQYAGGIAGNLLEAGKDLRVAGLAGLTNSYASGPVSGPVAGGVVGYIGNIPYSKLQYSIANLYWDPATTGASVGYNSYAAIPAAGGTITISNVSPLDAAAGAAYSSAHYNGFDFAAVWYMKEGATRPILRSEYATTIVTPHQLQLLDLDLAASYRLGSDLDLGNALAAAGDVWNPASGFSPIGTAAHAFTGSLDGAGHTVTGLSISRAGQDAVGLVGVNHGTIQNIAISNATITGQDGVGVVAGVNAGTVSNVYASGDVRGRAGVGVLAGQSAGSIVNAYSDGGVSGAIDVGGLVGDNEGRIDKVYSLARVDGADVASAGALIGHAAAASTTSASFVVAERNPGLVAIGNDEGANSVLELDGTSLRTLDAFRAAGWDIDAQYGTGSVWRMYEGATGPLLRSMLKQATVTVSKDYDGRADVDVSTARVSYGDADSSKIAGSLAASGNTEGSKYSGTHIDAALVAGLSSGQDGYDIQGAAAIDRKLLVLDFTASAAGKTYDGTTAATVTGAQLSGVVDGDSVGLVLGSASFDSKNAGVGKTVFVRGAGLTGEDAGQYRLATQVASTKADVEKKDLAIVIGAADKVYDGNSKATLTATYEGLLMGDSLSFATANSNGGTFADKNAGVAKDVTVSGLKLQGADAGNYNLLTPDTVVVKASITPKTVTAAIDNSKTTKVYDGTAATLAGLVASGFVTGDVVTLNAAGGIRYASKNAQASNPITASGLELSGADAANYKLTATQVSTGGTISKKQLSAADTAAVLASTNANRVYNGTTAGSAQVLGSFSGAIAGDDVHFDGVVTGTFANKNVGQNKTLSVSASSIAGALQGADSSNYTVASGTYSILGNITPATLTVGAAAANKVYDGSSSASVSLSSNKLGGDVITLSYSSALFDSKNAGARTATVSGITVSGADAGNYVLSELPVTAFGTITPKSLTASVLASEKTYDGTRDVGGAILLTGVLAGDKGAVGAVAASMTTSDKNAGTAKQVTATGVHLVGTEASNYTVGAAATGTVDVGRAQLVLGDFHAQDKVYDGTTAAEVGGTLKGTVYGTDQVTAKLSAAFADKHAGAAKQVLVDKAGTVLTGVDANNYELRFDPGADTLTAAIAQRALTVGLDGKASGKVYDAKLTGTPVFTDDRIQGDVFSVGAAWAEFNVKDVGTRELTARGLTLAGADAGDYFVSNSNGMVRGTALITPATLFVDIVGFQAASKTYDGTAVGQAAAVETVVHGILDGDVVDFTGGRVEFADKNVGQGKTVTYVVDESSFGGPSAYNYVVQRGSNAATATADIKPRDLTVSAVVAGKVYDGTRTASGTLSSDQVVGDQLTLSYGSAQFDSKNAGSRKATFDGIALTGADASNYHLVSTEASADGTIARAQVTVHVDSFQANDKVYDGNTGATFSLDAKAAGAVVGDQVAVVGGRAAFVDKHAGAGKAVQLLAEDLQLAGADAANYELVKPAAGAVLASDSADISRAQLHVGFTGAGKVYDGSAAARVVEHDDRVAGDELVVGVGGATFANKNAGVAKAITVSGVTVGGADSGNYEVLVDATAQADITPKALGIELTVADKVYDGSMVASLARPAQLVGLVDGDVLGVDDSRVVAAFADKNAGLNKTVTVQGLSLAGDAATLGNYTLVDRQTSHATIERATLRVVGSEVEGKVYDGTTVARVTDVGRLAGVIEGDNVALRAGQAYFEDKNAGQRKLVSVDVSLAGGDAGNYKLESATVHTAADIARAQLGVTVEAASKRYDGTTGARITGGSLTGLVQGDTLKLDLGSAVAEFVDARAGSGKLVLINGFKVTGDAQVLMNYEVMDVARASADILTGLVRIVEGGVVVGSRVYDGTTLAQVIASGRIEGVLAGEDVQIKLVDTHFADKNVGTAKTVTGTYVLAGADAANYSFEGDVSFTGAASITPAQLTARATVANKVYDGTTAAQILGVALDGVVAGDVVRLSSGVAAQFETKAAGRGRTADVTGLAIEGPDATNYELASTAKASADIARLRVDAAGGAVQASRLYDGTTKAEVQDNGHVQGAIAGDEVLVALTDAHYSDKNAGAGKSVSGMFELQGADAGNYELTNADFQARADITPRHITLTVDDKSRPTHAENPEFTWTVGGDGLAEGETNATVFSGGPQTAAQTSSPDGVYEIAAGNVQLFGESRSNYVLEARTSGRLTVGSGVAPGGDPGGTPG